MTTTEYRYLWNQINERLNLIKTEKTPIDTRLYTVMGDDTLSDSVFEHCHGKLTALHPDKTDSIPIKVVHHRLITLSQSIRSLFSMAS